MSYTFSLSRRSLPVRCLCLLLVVLVLWCFFMVPRAGAVATEAATVAYAGALIGTILVGAGVVFSSHGDMQAVGAAMYKSWIKSSNAIGSTISAIASWALEHGEAVAKGALRVGKDMYQVVVDAFSSGYSSGRFMYDTDVSQITKSNVGDFTAAFNRQLLKNCTVSIDGHIYDFFASRDADEGLFIYSSVDGGKSSVICHKPWSSYFGGSSGVSDHGVYLYYSKMYGNLSVGIGYRTPGGDFSGSGWVDLGSLPAIVSPAVPLPDSIVIPTSDLAYPSDNTLVRMPDIPSVDTVTGTVTFPSDAAYTKDAVSVPYPVDAEGVKVPDIPYDKVVDQSTGKTLDDTDTGTDTKPGEGTGTETGSGVSGLIGTIIGLLKNFFDSPSDFKLDMDGFRNLAIADKFPFCIPFDMVDSVKQFAATAADYQFRIKFDTQYFSVDHTVDLTPIAVPLAFFRYIVCVWFVWVLMSRTHDLMKW